MKVNKELTEKFFSLYDNRQFVSQEILHYLYDNRKDTNYEANCYVNLNGCYAKSLCELDGRFFVLRYDLDGNDSGNYPYCFNPIEVFRLTNENNDDTMIKYGCKETNAVT